MEKQKVIFFGLFESAHVQHDRMAIKEIDDGEDVIQRFFEWLETKRCLIERQTASKAIIKNCKIIR
jgi:hypothetical protein